MKSDERARQDLRRRLEEVLGEEDATTMMGHTPSEEYATKGDIGVLRADVGVVQSDVGLLKADVTSFRREVKLNFTGMEERFDLKLEAQEHRLAAAFRSEMIAQTRTFVFSMVAVVASMGSIALAAARLN